jgi:hypothetical protein
MKAITKTQVDPSKIMQLVQLGANQKSYTAYVGYLG